MADPLNLRPAVADRPPLTPQLFVGLLAIAVGVLLTLDNLGLVHAFDYLRYWPAAVVALGLLKIWGAREGGGAVGGFVVTIIGLWLLVEQTMDVRVGFADMWPLLVVFFGASLVWRGLTGVRGPGADPSSTVRATAILSGVTLAVTSRAFRGGDITAVMGGCNLDFRQAAINGDATIDLFVLWGGVELRVPDDWVVVSQVVPLMGAVEDKTRPPAGPVAHRLVLRGFVVMGGVEIQR